MRKVREMQVPTSVTELRDDLLETYTEIGLGRIKLQMAKEKSNAAGKIIKSVAVQLEYAVARKETPEIAFLREEPKSD
jgi:septum formation topological specificity factor MinE